MNGPLRIACFAKGIPSYTFSTLNSLWFSYEKADKTQTEHRTAELRTDFIQFFVLLRLLRRLEPLRNNQNFFYSSQGKCHIFSLKEGGVTQFFHFPFCLINHIIEWLTINLVKGRFIFERLGSKSRNGTHIKKIGELGRVKKMSGFQ